MWTAKHLAAWRTCRKSLTEASEAVHGQAGGWLAGEDFGSQFELLLFQVDANISLIDSDLAIQDAIQCGDVVLDSEGNPQAVEYDRPGRPV